MMMKNTEDLRREWMSRGYRESEFEWQCELYPMNNPNSYTKETGIWIPFFCKEYQCNSTFRQELKSNHINHVG